MIHESASRGPPYRTPGRVQSGATARIGDTPAGCGMFAPAGPRWATPRRALPVAAHGLDNADGKLLGRLLRREKVGLTQSGVQRGCLLEILQPHQDLARSQILPDDVCQDHVKLLVWHR